jgi:sulfate adenylyltransferase
VTATSDAGTGQHPGDPPDRPERPERPEHVLVGPDRAAELTSASLGWPSLTLTPQQLADLELLLLGAFGPVPGYPEITLRDSLPVPVLALPAAAAQGLRPGDTVALRDPEGVMLAALHLRAVTPDPPPTAPAGAAPAGAPRAVRLSGRVEGIALPHHPDHPALRLRPAELRAELRARGWLVPGQPPPWAVWADGLLHTADVGRIRALTRQGKRCVVLAPVGGADPSDAHHHLRVRALHAALTALDEPVSPTEATLVGQAVALEATRPAHPTGRAADAARYQTGAATSHAAAGPAGAPARGTGSPVGQPARALLVLVPVAPSPELAAPREPGMLATSPQGVENGVDQETADHTAALIALRAHVAEFYGLGGGLTGPAMGAPGRMELAALLAAGTPIPAELTPPAVAAELARAYPPRWARGCAVLFTGLSGSGKSTLANLLVCRLLERGDRHVTLLDGDVVRTHLSKGLGFSQADRNTNVTRIGFVAAEVAAAGGTVVCAPIAPYAEVRAEVRAMVERTGAGFVLVHVATPLAVCEERDRKGLYAKARAGLLPEFTGISDPYEDPTDAEVVVDTARLSADDAVNVVLDHLRTAGWIL